LLAHLYGLGPDDIDYIAETQPDAIRQIEAGTHTYFVKVGSKEVEVIVSSRLGDKYLTTEPDSTPENNLLSLPECP
jgi:hypothetical protein